MPILVLRNVCIDTYQASLYYTYTFLLLVLHKIELPKKPVGKIIDHTSPIEQFIPQNMYQNNYVNIPI